MKKPNLLFLCTGNSCRSQMAEGWGHALKSDLFNFYSAGIEIHGQNPNAIKVMAEVGIDISQQQSQHIDEFDHIDIVVTVCSHAHETCPIFPRDAKIVHVGFEDPYTMAREIEEKGGNQQQQLECYRQIRDQIKAFIEKLPQALNKLKIES